MRTTRTVALALAGALTLAGLAACGESPNANNKATTVLNPVSYTHLTLPTIYSV